MNTIDYDLLARAAEEYGELGYRQVEVPWRVSSPIVDTTKPAGCRSYVIEGTGKSLVASGEQGFMSLMNKGILPGGKYQTITPCFRDESYDDIHSKQFMKLELIRVDPPTELMALQGAVAAMSYEVAAVMTTLWPGLQVFFTRQVDKDPLRVPGTDAWDLECVVGDRKIELGSYGARRAHFGTWIYGTGLAEPRFSKTMRAGVTRI
jgi:hypothetical protein